MSTEIAVHGYHHIDFRKLTPEQGVVRLKTAVRAFERHSIDVYGFRCPYLSCSDALMEAIPKGMFRYGSNRAIREDDVPPAPDQNAAEAVDTIYRLYRPRGVAEIVSTPWMNNDMVEIPVNVPDDIQLFDGLRLPQEAVSGVWARWLDRAHERGELLSLLFHPELADIGMEPLVRTVQAARGLRPAVWIARLKDISDWWREKSRFQSQISEDTAGLRVSFMCSPRATILVKGIDPGGMADTWDGSYFLWNTTPLEMPAAPRPFVGVAADVPGTTISFLRDQGYILDPGDMAPRCSIFLDAEKLAQLPSQVEILNWIEGTGGPLVKYGRWPDGAKSALCISGDLDALSLWDYASRLFAR